MTSAWGVGLYSCRGQSSKTFVYEAVQEYARQGKPVTVIFCGDWDPTGRCVPRSVIERMHRYGNGELDLDFQQIAVTADDVRSGQFTTHDVNTRDVNYKRYREECLSEGIDPHVAVEVEALTPGLLRSRLNDAIEALVDDVRKRNEARMEEAERELLRSLQGTVTKIVRGPQGSQRPRTTRTSRPRAPHLLHRLKCSGQLLSCENSNCTLGRPRRKCGDYDQSGVHMFSSLAEDVIAFAEASGAGVEFQRVAVTPEQIASYNLPTAPPKATDRRSFSGATTTQAEALPPDILAAVVREAIEAHRDPEVHRQALAREEAERRAIRERLNGRPEPGPRTE